MVICWYSPLRTCVNLVCRSWKGKSDDRILLLLCCCCCEIQFFRYSHVELIPRIVFIPTVPDSVHTALRLWPLVVVSFHLHTQSWPTLGAFKAQTLWFNANIQKYLDPKSPRGTGFCWHLISGGMRARAEVLKRILRSLSFIVCQHWGPNIAAIRCWCETAHRTLPWHTHADGHRCSCGDLVLRRCDRQNAACGWREAKIQTDSACALFVTVLVMCWKLWKIKQTDRWGRRRKHCTAANVQVTGHSKE